MTPERTSQDDPGEAEGDKTEGDQQFVNQFDGLPFRQASERKQCGARGCPEVP
jgi:hypothetical protein